MVLSCVSPIHNRFRARPYLLGDGAVRPSGRPELSQGKCHETWRKHDTSGLQYKVLKEGTGKSPKATDVVVVNYRGTLINGKEFDSSYKSGKPIEFPLNRVIPGWTEGVQLMKEVREVRILHSSEPGLWFSRAGGVIGPDETLIFEVELLKVR